MLFVVAGSKLVIHARAEIVGVDSELSCKLGLLTLARQDPDLILKSYVSANYSTLNTSANELYDYVYGNGTWYASMNMSNGTGLFSTGTQKTSRIKCVLPIPLPAYEFERNCKFFYITVLNITADKDVVLQTPDGNETCKIKNLNVGATASAPEQFGVEPTCVALDEYTKEIYGAEEPPPGEKIADKTMTEDYNNSAESIIVPIRVPKNKGNIYHLAVAEAAPDINNPDGTVLLVLRRRQTTADCSLQLTAEITNTSPIQSFDRWKGALR